MRWDRFFEDLEDQLASEWEAERAVLDTEAERLRLSRVTLRERLQALAASSSDDHALELGDGTVLRARIAAVGADWLATDAGGTEPGVLVVPLAAVQSLTLAHADLLRSARPPASESRAGIAERMGLGFLLRDAARRRVPVMVHLLGGRALSGTIDRAAADHLDLALHDRGASRRAGEVTGYRVVPFAAIASVRIDGATGGALG